MEQNLIKSEIESRIFTIRGMQVMIDSDLAILYGTETKFINRAISRNQNRFPTDFAFRLNPEEWADLRFQNGTLNENQARGKHRKYPPIAFTEQGIVSPWRFTQRPGKKMVCFFEARWIGARGSQSSAMINLSDQSLRDQSYGLIGTIDRKAIDSKN